MISNTLERNKLPVIISSSCTGLLVSYSLSKKKIKHILLGDNCPDDTPKLGESMNEGATADCWKWLDEDFREFFYPKSHISLMNGKVASMIHLNNPRRNIEGRVKRMGAPAALKNTADSLIHIDRVGFDKKLYEKTVASPYCLFIKETNAQPQYDKATDKIVAIALSDGSTIDQPQYVFDATGPRSLVGSLAGVKRTPLTDAERVVWNHYYASNAGDLSEVWWRFGTNLLKLDKARDGIDGISWLIPLGTTLSVGVSVEQKNAQELNKNEIIKLLEEAYERRGMAFLKQYPQARHDIADLFNQYFVCDRAFGNNWLMCGAAFIQAWFPSSAGMSTSTAAAHFAPLLLENPSLAKVYEDNLRSLIPFHDQLHSMIKGQSFTARWQAFEFWADWLARIPPRFFNHLYTAQGTPTTTTPRFKRIANVSKAMVGRPMLQLPLWGFLTIRAKQPDELEKQADSYSGYFNRTTFKLHNYFGGWVVYISSKLKQALGLK